MLKQFFPPKSFHTDIFTKQRYNRLFCHRESFFSRSLIKCAITRIIYVIFYMWRLLSCLLIDTCGAKPNQIPLNIVKRHSLKRWRLNRFSVETTANKLVSEFVTSNKSFLYWAIIISPIGGFRNYIKLYGVEPAEWFICMWRADN